MQLSSTEMGKSADGAGLVGEETKRPVLDRFSFKCLLDNQMGRSYG